MIRVDYGENTRFHTQHARIDEYVYKIRWMNAWIDDVFAKQAIRKNLSHQDWSEQTHFGLVEPVVWLNKKRAIYLHISPIPKWSVRMRLPWDIVCSSDRLACQCFPLDSGLLFMPLTFSHIWQRKTANQTAIEPAKLDCGHMLWPWLHQSSFGNLNRVAVTLKKEMILYEVHVAPLPTI